LPKRAQKDLDKIDQRFAPKIKAALVALTQNPYVGKKLEGKLSSLYSYRVWPYRIIYEVRKRELVVLIIRVAHRQSAYG
jgi:mRNA interferase RelE/StbE